ncbi:MAG: leucyl aminopeptidase [Gemmatimonadetes bacterium]|nr:leucyl aminopeptidase [Gemmatimonadota bacterium]
MPKIDVVAVSAERAQLPVLVVPWLEGEPVPDVLRNLDAAVGGALARALEKRDARGSKDEVFLLYGPGGAGGAGAAGPERLLLCGLGKRADLSLERLRRAAGAGVSRARALRATQVGIWLPVSWVAAAGGTLDLANTAQALVEGAVLGAWRFDELKTVFEDDERTPEVERVTLCAHPGTDLAALRAAADTGRILAECQNLARNWVNRPANLVTPRVLADEAQEIARRHGLEATILDRAGIEREGLGALAAVARGSEEEPRFIVLECAGGKGAPLALVGKGVTFDSGGLSLKPADNMETMKYDMAGAAAALAALDAIARLSLPANVVAVVPATENLPSGRATRPGDVVRSYAGKTIEILNTDAEGRLIVADALAYAAAKYKPAAMVDAATLTGACIVALGHQAIGLLGNDEGVLAELERAGARSGERVWRLPLWEEYREQLRSQVADIKNTGGRPAGVITGAWFLREFVGDVAWAHLDIAGTAWAETEGPYQPKGATGVGVRLLTEWVRGRA